MDTLCGKSPPGRPKQKWQRRGRNASSGYRNIRWRNISPEDKAVSEGRSRGSGPLLIVFDISTFIIHFHTTLNIFNHKLLIYQFITCEPRWRLKSRIRLRRYYFSVRTFFFFQVEYVWTTPILILKLTYTIGNTRIFSTVHNGRNIKNTFYLHIIEES